MYAIVNIAGQQFKVEEGKKIFVHRLDAEPGDSMKFDEVLLMDTDGKIEIGKPYLEGANVMAQIIAHTKSDKVLVFKKKRRKGYQTLNGHRQYMTHILIEGINAHESKTTSKRKTNTVEPQEITKPETESESGTVITE